jgi:hypothetical protein
MRILLSALLILASVSVGHAGKLELREDPVVAECQIREASPGVIEVFVVHLGIANTTRVSFSVPVPPCASLTWLGDVPQEFDTVIGESPTGVDVVYGACTPLPVVILRITYSITGPIESCCAIHAAGHGFSEPYSPTPIERWCDGRRMYTAAGIAYLNPNPSCECTTPAKRTTWSAVKQLYTTN